MDPVITNLPIDISVHTDTGLPTATVSWTPPTASDNSREGATLTSNYNPGAAFPIGTTTVTYTATDGAGNRATASFYIVVTGKIESKLFLPCLPSITVLLSEEFTQFISNYCCYPLLQT